MPNLPTVRTIAELRREIATWRGDGPIGLVPTMGALHRGHLALVRSARDRGRRVIVSIFVNPTQFAPTEDFSNYPRNEESDLQMLAAAGVDLVFAPAVEEMYPDGFATTVIVGGPAEGLESNFRPHFFRGVATVVSKLLIAALPDFAIFGEKDYQQLTVIKRMVADLGIPVEIIGHPTVREPDGLALSSRNAYLSSPERKVAPRLHAILAETALGIRGQLPAPEALIGATRALDELGFKVDYVELRNAETLTPPADPRAEPLRLLAAAWLGRTRLIDNIAV